MTTKKNTQKKPRIGLIGCGWLGTEVVKVLVDDKFDVVATTTTPDKLGEITKLGAHAELLSLPFQHDEGSTATAFSCQTLVVCIPPQLRKGKTDYADKIRQIVQYAELGSVDKIILISSTAIYEGIIGDVSENSTLKRNITKVDILAKSEQSVLGFNGQSIVLRCSGLVGEDRHPGRFFKHNKKLTAPNAYVNLVHQVDVVEQIRLLIDNSYIEGIFNVTSDMQVTKKHYYTIASTAVGIEPPMFDDSSEVELGKYVVGAKLKDSLHYRYQYGDLVSWLFYQ